MDEQDYGCDDCKYLKGKRCSLWEIKIDDPHNSHCEVVLSEYGRIKT